MKSVWSESLKVACQRENWTKDNEWNQRGRFLSVTSCCSSSIGLRVFVHEDNCPKLPIIVGIKRWEYRHSDHLTLEAEVKLPDEKEIVMLYYWKLNYSTGRASTLNNKENLFLLYKVLALSNFEWSTEQGKNPQAQFSLTSGVRSGRKWAPPVPVTHPKGWLSWTRCHQWGSNWGCSCKL